jgi:ribonucleoside-diphosphate reductase alpha chain
MLSIHPSLTGADLAKIRTLLQDKVISSSQRALQFGGLPILEKNARLYNCSVSFCDRPDFFAETFYLLLCGAGVGFSVQKHHTQQLQWWKGEGEYSHTISDTIEGWADAVKALTAHYFLSCPKPVFDYSLITSRELRHGGRITPEPLRTSLEKADDILTSAYTTYSLCRDVRSTDPLCPSSGSLLPIHAFDITMHLADAVLSGGVRRSATIAVFSIDDKRMMQSKTGNWFTDNPQRGRANISAMITPSVSHSDFASVFTATREFGEPGFIFSKSSEYINNPCVEITMCPLLIISPDGETVENYSLSLVDPENRKMWEDKGYVFHSGFQMCNLTTINASKPSSDKEWGDAVRCATILGTHQARFTHLPYLGSITERIVKRESLLGVSMTGIMAQLPSIQWERLAKLAVDTNKEYAAKLGIPQASRVTCVKPEGTASLVLDTSAGIHPYHAHKYIRRVQAKPEEECYQRYAAANPSHCLDSVWGENLKVIEFACSAPASAIVKADLTAIEHLDIAKRVNQEWVRTGTALPSRLEGAHHNVSITVTVKDDEWGSVSDYLWLNRDLFTGVSLLSDFGDTTYAQAPFEEVRTEEQLARYQHLLDTLTPVDYNGVESAKIEAADACSGGVCERFGG